MDSYQGRVKGQEAWDRRVSQCTSYPELPASEGILGKIQKKYFYSLVLLNIYLLYKIFTQSLQLSGPFAWPDKSAAGLGLR